MLRASPWGVVMSVGLALAGCRRRPTPAPAAGSGSAAVTGAVGAPSPGPVIAPALADAAVLANLSGAERQRVCTDLMSLRPAPAMQAQVACRAAAIGQTAPGPDAGARCRAALAACVAAPPPAITRPPCLPPEVVVPPPPACATSTMADLRRCALEVTASAQRVVGDDVCAAFDHLAPVPGATGPDTRATDAFIAANLPSAACMAVSECSRGLFEPPRVGP